MKFSEKGLPPASFEAHKALANEDWQPSFDHLPADVKRDLQSHLLIEQRYVCAYCGRGLEADRTDSHIDHFRPQAKFNDKSRPDLRLAYDNLFCSCGPQSLPHPKPKTYPRTCGDAKANWFDDDLFIIPSDPGCEARFAYGASGAIIAADQGDPRAAEMIKRLRLDDPSLSQQRGVIIQALEADFLADSPTEERVALEIDMWRTPDDSGRLLSFGHVAAIYLTQEQASVAKA